LFPGLFEYTTFSVSLYVFDHKGTAIGHYTLPATAAQVPFRRGLQLRIEYDYIDNDSENIWRYDEEAWEVWKTETPKKNWWAGLPEHTQQRRFSVNLNYANFNHLNRPQQAWPRREGWHLDCAHISDEQTLWWAVGEMLFGPNICAPDSVSRAASRLFKNRWPYHERRLHLDNIDGLRLPGGAEALEDLLETRRYGVELFDPANAH
jgi:hypothetical protein